MTGPPVVVPALTIRQPWADAIVVGGKDVENRGWATCYRGPLALHAGLGWDPAGQAAILALTGRAGAALIERARARRGVVVGVADLVDVHPDSGGGCCSPWAAGRCHWHLAEPRQLTAPVAATGRLGLWRWPVPAGLQAAVMGR